MIRIQRSIILVALSALTVPGVSRIGRSAERTPTEKARGSVLLWGTVGAPDVTLKGLPGGPVSDDGGRYRAAVPPGWSGTVTPVKEGYAFEPRSRHYDKVQEDLTSEDYEASVLNVTLSGRVGLPGVTMQGLPGHPVTDAEGRYTAEVQRGWSGVVTPVREGFVFEPESRIYKVITRGFDHEDYAARAIVLRISGNAGIAGVILQGLPGRVGTDAEGNYSVNLPYGWSGKVAPEKDGCRFEPASRVYASVKTDIARQDYRPLPETVVLSDIIRVAEGPLEGVKVTAEPGDATDATDFQGRYVLRVPYGWSGRLHLTHDEYDFPQYVRHEDVTHHIIDGQRFSALEKPMVPAPRTSAMRPRPVLSTSVGQVLVIPTREVAPEQFAETTEDMQVMLHILQERLSEPRMIMGVLHDYGDIFGNARSLEALYLQGYAALFVLQSDLPFALPPQRALDDQTQGETGLDPVWQRARQRLYAPPNAAGYRGALGRGREMDFDQFQDELLRTLRHAANIRHLDPNEQVIVTIVTQDTPAGMHRGPVGAGFSAGGGAWFQGGTQGFSGGTFSMGGGSAYSGPPIRHNALGVPSRGSSTSRSGRLAPEGGQDSSDPSHTSYGFDGTNRTHRTYGTQRMLSPATVLTIQAGKADVDAFAGGQIGFEQFRHKAKVFTY